MTLAVIVKLWREILIGFLAFLLLVSVIVSNHKSNKLDRADSECVERINKVNDAYQSALDAWKAKVFIVENELETERNNIKIEFRDIRHETQKIITDRIYTECKLTDDGLSVANKAINSANTNKPSN